MLALDPNVAIGRQDLMTLFDQINIACRNFCSPSSPAGLAIGSASTAKVKVVNTVTFNSAGVPKSKTTAEVAFTASTMDIPAVATAVQEACYFVCVNGSGTLSLVMGTITSGAGTAKLPERSTVADGIAILGYVRIAVAAAAPGSGTNFVAGTTALSDGRLTVTYVDLAGPVFPLFSAAQ